HVDDDLTRGGVYSARVHDWARGPHLPRVCDHDRNRDSRVGPGVTDTDAVDVRASVERAWPRLATNVDGTRHRRHRKTNSGFVWRIVVVVPASSVDIAGDLGDLSRG